LNEFFSWYRASVRPPFSKAVVREYRSHLESAGARAFDINVRLAAIRKLAAEAADSPRRVYYRHHVERPSAEVQLVSGNLGAIHVARQINGSDLWTEQ
jgi:hypothetical protein